MDVDAMLKRAHLTIHENASFKIRLNKLIQIAGQVQAALSPYMACHAGCSHCCHMGTLIYAHEAERLAAVSGREMIPVRHRPRDQVIALVDNFHGRPCPFLRNNRCSVYNDRPFICRVHHSLNTNPQDCSLSLPPDKKPPVMMYNPDILEVPYTMLTFLKSPREPWGFIQEFFADE